MYPGPELNKYSSLFRLPCLSPLFHILICFFWFDFWMFLTHMKHLKSCSSTAASLGIFTKLRILRVACVGAKEIFVDLAYVWTINSAPSQLELLGSREIISSSKRSIRTVIDLVSCWRFFGHGVQTQKTFESIFPSWRLDFPFLTLGSLSSSPRWAQEFYLNRLINLLVFFSKAALIADLVCRVWSSYLGRRWPFIPSPAHHLIIQMLTCLVRESFNESWWVVHCVSICYQLEGEPFHPNVRVCSHTHCFWLASETWILWSMKKSKLQTFIKRWAGFGANLRPANNCLDSTGVAQRRLPVTVEFVLSTQSRKVTCCSCDSSRRCRDCNPRTRHSPVPYPKRCWCEGAGRGIFLFLPSPERTRRPEVSV